MEILVAPDRARNVAGFLGARYAFCFSGSGTGILTPAELESQARLQRFFDLVLEIDLERLGRLISAKMKGDKL